MPPEVLPERCPQRTTTAVRCESMRKGTAGANRAAKGAGAEADGVEGADGATADAVAEAVAIDSRVQRSRK